MKKKHLAILAFVLGALVAARLLLHEERSDTAQQLSDAGVHRITGDDVQASSISWLQVTAPPKDGETEPAILRYERSGGSWIIASRGGVPADGKAIEEFLEKAVGLAGETRGRGEAAWATFGVEPAKALKVEMGVVPETAQVTIFAGKQGDTMDAHFARVEGRDEIVHVRAGLRGLLGLWSETATLSQERWLKLEVAGLDEADLARVKVDRPDASLVLARKAESDEWIVEEPAFEWPPIPGLGATAGRMGSFRIGSVLDSTAPACAAEPVATVTFTRKEGDDVVVRVRGIVEASEDLAVTIDGQPHCWSLSTWSLATLVPRASALWEVPGLDSGADVVPTRLSVEQGGKTIAARLEGEQWKVQGAGMEPARAASIASALRYLRMEDFAKEPGLTGAPHAVVTIEGGGKRRVLRLLAERPGGVGEWYARVDGAPVPAGHVLVLSKATVQSLLP